MPQTKNSISVSSEIGALKRVIIHSPDNGIGMVVPYKAQDWLFEDIVHLETIRRKEYDYYVKLLLYFLDPQKIKGRLAEINSKVNNFDFFKPDNAGFYNSDNVIELQLLLADILNDHEIKIKLIASVCAIENCTFQQQEQLQQLDAPSLAKVFMSGALLDEPPMFAPLPNFIFTRDIGIIINDHILLNKPAKKARTREALLTKYIFFHHPLFKAYRKNIIELPNPHNQFLMPKTNGKGRVTLEGGDVMMVAPRHLLIGVSERTTMEAAHLCINILFEKKLVDKISVIQIPKKRDYMHIDTIFTQVSKNVWVLLGKFSKKYLKHEGSDPVQKALMGNKNDETISILQFQIQNPAEPEHIKYLEDLLADISRTDLKCTEKVQFIYSGNNRFPYDVREQWTDSCNLLALKEGVVLGYDRNEKTLDAFRQKGFKIIEVETLLELMESDKIKVAEIEKTVITMPSAELSRARGGFHCMSLPLLRENI